MKKRKSYSLFTHTSVICLALLFALSIFTSKTHQHNRRLTLCLCPRLQEERVQGVEELVGAARGPGTDHLRHRPAPRLRGAGGGARRALRDTLRDHRYPRLGRSVEAAPVSVSLYRPPSPPPCCVTRSLSSRWL